MRAPERKDRRSATDEERRKNQRGSEKAIEKGLVPIQEVEVSSWEWSKAGEQEVRRMRQMICCWIVVSRRSYVSVAVFSWHSFSCVQSMVMVESATYC